MMLFFMMLKIRGSDGLKAVIRNGIRSGLPNLVASLPIQSTAVQSNHCKFTFIGIYWENINLTKP